MVMLGRIVGGILGFTVGVIFTEVIFVNQRENEPLVAVAVPTVVGVFVGSWLVRRFASRRAKPS
jgi:H+/Cl- antiporter ClcA